MGPHAKVSRNRSSVGNSDRASTARIGNARSHDLTTAISIHGLANVKLAQGRLDEAIEFHQQCLDIRKTLWILLASGQVSHATRSIRKMASVQPLVSQKKPSQSSRMRKREPDLLLAGSLYKRSQPLISCCRRRGRSRSPVRLPRRNDQVFLQRKDLDDRLVQFRFSANLHRKLAKRGDCGD